MHPVLSYKICKTVWNRYLNASLNTSYLAVHDIKGNDHPLVFTRNYKVDSDGENDDNDKDEDDDIGYDNFDGNDTFMMI